MRRRVSIGDVIVRGNGIGEQEGDAVRNWCWN